MFTQVPDAGELLIHHRHIARANMYKVIYSSAGMAAYRGGVITSSVGIYTLSYFVIICLAKQAQRSGMETYHGVSSLAVKVLSSYYYVAPKSRVACA